MKKHLLIILSLIILGCGSSKRIQKYVSSGDYDSAINASLKKLRTNKHKKKKVVYIQSLKDAFEKASSEDTQRISYLKQDKNPANYESIYNLYLTLNKRQKTIKPFLPLYLNGKKVAFNFKNYDTEIIKIKENLSSYLYENASRLLKSDSKMNFRQAYDDFNYIESINPGYKNVTELKNEAHKKGVDHVIISMINNTRQVIPKRLENDLLNFDTYGLNNLWTVYHSTVNVKTSYSFAINVILKKINISPERIKEREVIQEKKIKDGWKYTRDRKGNILKDSLGNKIKVDKFKNIRCTYIETKQFKASSISGNVELINLSSKQLIEKFPLKSEFIFEHFYATSTGDRRALDKNLIDYLDNRKVRFPTNEQMIYDNGEDLKLQLKKIITNNGF